MPIEQLVHNELGYSSSYFSQISYSGSNNAIGRFSTGTNPTNLGITSGIILSTGRVQDAVGPNSSGSTSTNNGTGSDPDLAALIPGYTISDAAVLRFNYKPYSDSLCLRYVFASEEYPEFVNTSFNDVFGIFITGPRPDTGFYDAHNIALVPNTNFPVNIDNINENFNAQYYVNNHTIGQGTIEYDGFTTVLDACAVVVPNATYHIKIAIADVGDSSYDSALFIEKASLKAAFSSNSPVCEGESLTLYAFESDSTQFYWVGPNGFTSSLQNPLVSSMASDNEGVYYVYFVSVSDTILIDSVLVEMLPLPEVSILQNDTVLCHNQWVFLNAGSGYTSYRWYNSSNSQIYTTQHLQVNSSLFGFGTHQFWVVATDANGCANSDTVNVTLIDCTGIEYLQNRTLFVYPNPASSTLWLQLPTTTSPKLITLTDIHGKTVFSTFADGNETQKMMDLGSLRKGVYFISLVCDDIIYNNRIVVNP